MRVKNIDKKSKCPICGKYYMGQGAISRIDNKTEICSECGVNQAMRDFVNFLENHHNPLEDFIKEKADI